MKSLSAAIALLALAAALAGCTRGSQSPGPQDPAADVVTIQVFAAASLTEAFGEIEHDFEAVNPAVNVEFVFAGSSDLASQINEGAPADVFASANEAQMAAVGAQVARPEPFASNTLTIVVGKGNPLGVEGLQDLTRDDLVLVVCAPEVPCGAATEKVEEDAGLIFAPASEESNVSDVLGKVATGQADAGLVYVTDIARADGVEGIAFDGRDAAVNIYPIGTLASSKHPEAAKAFVQFVLSDDGRAVLASYGFGLP